MIKKLILGAAAFMALSGSAPAAEVRIDPARITEHASVLASDGFEGRAPASEGETKTVSYIISQFRAAGLEPAGEKTTTGRAWTQDVPLARFEIKGPVAVSVLAGARTLTWAQGEEVAIRAAQTGASRISIRNAPVVFLGYGVKAPERDWDDYKDIDLAGKIGLVLVNDPDFETGRGDFGGRAMTYYGRWTYKFEEAARRGALGVLVIHETAPASYGWATVRNSNVDALFDIIRKDPSQAHAPLEGWIQRDAAAALLREAGLDFETLKKAAQTRAFRPAMLPGVSLSVDFAVEAQQVVTRNVAGELRGTRRPDERIIYTAHWDHLGVGQPDAQGDRIYNGAVDNAAGVGALIEIARAFAGAARTERSVMFLALAAEEKGLLGSEYYAADPLYPLATTVAVVNMDAPSTAGSARDFTTSGDAPVTLQDDLIAVGRASGRRYSPDPRPEAGSFFRSDHFPFAKRGVPAISFGSGRDLVNGGTAAGDAWAKAYTADRYHQPSDEIGHDWNTEGVARDAALLYELGRRLANSREWPQWKPGAEFKAVRDRTAAQRK